MSRRISDINQKIAYMTNHKTGPLLKTKRPLYLRNAVYNTRFGRQANYCQDESASLFTCLAEHDYNNAMCGDELRAMLFCEQQVLKAKSQKSDANSTTVGATDLNTKNKLLQQHPTVTSKHALRIQRNNYITLPMKRSITVPYKEAGEKN